MPRHLEFSRAAQKAIKALKKAGKGSQIKTAIDTGKIVPPAEKRDAPAPPPQMAQLLELLGKVDPAKLKALLEQAGAMKPEGEAPAKL